MNVLFNSNDFNENHIHSTLILLTNKHKSNNIKFSSLNFLNWQYKKTQFYRQIKEYKLLQYMILIPTYIHPLIKVF